MKKITILAIIITLSISAIYSQNKVKQNNMNNRAEIYLAGGCFWGTEHFLKQINGVEKTEVGYANGNSKTPTYDDISHKGTGHAEVVKVEYNPDIVTLQKILELYYMTIDPTSINKQGGDSGVQYRTGIYYIDNENILTIENSIQKLSKEHSEPIAIEVMPLENYYPAETKHQDYLDKNSGGYCHINPKLFEFAKQANSKPSEE